jgi:hypothetical protein
MALAKILGFANECLCVLWPLPAKTHATRGSRTEKVQFEHIWAAELPEPDLASELLVGIEYLISWWRKAYVSGGCRWLHENVRMTALLNSSAF